MRKTREQLQSENDELSIENGLYLRYMDDIENGRKPDAIESHSEKVRGERISITGKLYRATGGDGGIVVIIHSLDGRKDASIYTLERLQASIRDSHSEYTLPMRIVLDRLVIARNRVLDEKEHAIVAGTM